MLSVTNPFEPAIQRTVRLLFRPFRLEAYLALGFTAWLAGFTSMGGGRYNYQGGNNPALAKGMEDAFAWCQAHLTLILVLGAVLLGVLLGLYVLFQWLGCRGSFMFLDNVVQGRSQVVDPWHRFRTLAHSLLGARLLLGLGGMLAIGAVMGLGGWGLWRQWKGAGLSGSFFGLLALLILVLVAVFLLLAFANLVLMDLVVPVMYRDGIHVREALARVQAEILGPHLGSVLLYALLKVGVWMAIGIFAVVAGCLTCCLGFLPYLSTLLMLPGLVFLKYYNLGFLAQVGEGWRLLDDVQA